MKGFTAYDLVTVVIPTYNRNQFVREAVQSVIDQSYQHWELIVVDDGSTDDTAEMIRSINDHRITVLNLPHCGNIAQLRNIGAHWGSGKWIAFLDSDDLWMPDKLQIQLNSLNKEKAQWSYAGFELMNEAGSFIPVIHGEYKPLSGKIIKPLITYEATVPIGSLIVSRKLFEGLGGFSTDPKLFCREDYEFSLRLSLHADVVAVADTLVRIREHKDRTTNSFDNGSERSAFVYKHFLKQCTDKSLRKTIRRQYASQMAEASVKNLSKRNYLKGLRQLGSAFLIGNKTIALSIFAKALHLQPA